MKVHLARYEWDKQTKKKEREKLVISYFLTVLGLSYSCSCGDLTWMLAVELPSPLLPPPRPLQFIAWQSCGVCESWACVAAAAMVAAAAAAAAHKLTSRTSVGVLDWSCCSRALLPALTPDSCRCCWSCCRLVVSTRSICSWHALRQSWNKRGSDVIRHTPRLRLWYRWGAFTTEWRFTRQTLNSFKQGARL